MKRCIVLLLLGLTSIIHAQTPTPNPNALQPGLYHFEDLSSPQIELSGSWVIEDDLLLADEDGASLTFSVENTDYVTLYRRVYESPASFSLTVDEVENIISNQAPSEALAPIAVNISGTATITLARITTPLYLDYMTLIQTYATPVALFIPVIATPVPTVSWVDYIEATDELGEPYITGAVDNTVTAGDQFLGAVGVGILVALLVLIGVTLWDR